MSVIIPVFDDTNRLVRCLNALAKQTYEQDRFEVIVVDNGSSDELRHLASAFPFVRVTSESRPSQFAARNTGVTIAKGEILAFTDSDCIPSPEWIQSAVANLANQPNRVVAGKIAMFAKKPNKPSSVELYDMATGFAQRQCVQKLKFGATANLFVFRDNFIRVGQFDAVTKSCGDVEWGQRACINGLTIVYCDDVVVSHPARRTFSEIFNKTVRTIGGVQDLRKRCRETFDHSLDRSIFFHLTPPVNHCIQVISDKRFARVSEKLRVIPVVVFVRYAGAFERLRLILGGETRRR